MSQHEARLTPLLAFPFGSFLMLRLEYVLLTDGNEVEAFILRLIEQGMEDERKRRYQSYLNALPPASASKEVARASAGAVLDLSRDSWAPLSHAHLRYDLYGLVQSDTTLKRALASLKAKGLIRTRAGQGRYEPTAYQLNLEKITAEFERISTQGKAGYQPVTPSEGQKLTPSPEGQKMAPSEGQKMTPSYAGRGSLSDPLRGSIIDPNNIYGKNTTYSKRVVEEPEEPDTPPSQASSTVLALSTDAAAAIEIEGNVEETERTEGTNLGRLSAEEIALIQVSRQQCQAPAPSENGLHLFPASLAQASLVDAIPPALTEDLPGFEPGSGSELAVASPRATACVPDRDRGPLTQLPPVTAGSVPAPTDTRTDVGSAASPPPSAPLPAATQIDAEAIVRLIERKRGTPYDAASRLRQLAAARQLLDLRLPLDLEVLERVYDECHDSWWQQHYGDLHVTHLVEREKQHGEARIARLVRRVQARAAQAVMHADRPSPGVVRGLPLLEACIPLQQGGGMTPDDAVRLCGEIRRHRSLGLCTTGIAALADGTYAALVDNTFAATARQVAFYSRGAWQARAGTLTSALELFGQDPHTLLLPSQRFSAFQERRQHA